MHVLAYIGARTSRGAYLTAVMLDGATVGSVLQAGGAGQPRPDWGNTSASSHATAELVMRGFFGTDVAALDLGGAFLAAHLCRFRETWIYTCEQAEDFVRNELLWDAEPLLSLAREGR